MLQRESTNYAVISAYSNVSLESLRTGATLRTGTRTLISYLKAIAADIRQSKLMKSKKSLKDLR